MNLQISEHVEFVEKLTIFDELLDLSFIAHSYLLHCKKMFWKSSLTPTYS